MFEELLDGEFGLGDDVSHGGSRQFASVHRHDDGPPQAGPNQDDMTTWLPLHDEARPFESFYYTGRPRGGQPLCHCVV